MFWSIQIIELRFLIAQEHILEAIGGYGSGCNQWKYARQFTIFNDQVYLADHPRQ